MATPTAPLARLDPNERVRCRQLERIGTWWLTLGPGSGSPVKESRLWSDWPARHSAAGG